MDLQLSCSSYSEHPSEDRDGMTVRHIEVNGVDFSEIIKQAQNIFGEDFFLDQMPFHQLENYYNKMEKFNEQIRKKIENKSEVNDMVRSKQERFYLKRICLKYHSSDETCHANEAIPFALDYIDELEEKLLDIEQRLLNCVKIINSVAEGNEIQGK